MTNEKSTAKTKDEMHWAMVRPELEAVLEEMWLARVLPLDFGAALERLRLWREMSQEELARDAECPVRTIRRLETVRRSGRSWRRWCGFVWRCRCGGGLARRFWCALDGCCARGCMRTRCCAMCWSTARIWRWRR